MIPDSANAVSQLVAAPLTPKIKKTAYLPDLYDYLHNLEKQRSQNESLRLLYVAATRAERHLHIVSTVKLKEKKGELEIATPAKNTPLGDLWPVIESVFSEKIKYLRSTKQEHNRSKPSNFQPKIAAPKNT